MKLVADECVDFGIIRQLRHNGVEVFSILEELASVKDKTVLEVANEKGWLLLTEDRDFGELVFRFMLPNHGVVYVRIQDLDRKIKIARVVSIILNHYDQLLGSFTVITNDKMKIRRIP